MRSQGGRRGRPPKPKGESGPTPQTILKLRPEVMHGLTADQQHAAIAIERAYSAIVERGLCKAQSLEPRVDGQEMAHSDEKGEKLIQIFNAWSREMERRQDKRRRPRHRNVVINMVHDGTTPTEMDHNHHRRYGWASEILIEGLEMFLRVRQEMSID